MNSFFRPGIVLMNRLQYPGKFLLVGLVLIFPLVVVLAQFMNGVSADIEFSAKEQIGLEYNEPLVTFLQHVEQHSVLVAGYTGGDASLKDSIDTLQAAMDDDLAAMQQVDNRLSTRLDVVGRWQ